MVYKTQLYFSCSWVWGLGRVTAVGSELIGLGSWLCFGFRSVLGLSGHAAASIYPEDILMAMAEMQEGWDESVMPDTENRLVVAKRRGGGGIDWEFGISIDKLVYIGWINNKVLQYST